jgi:hypothetical protein
VTAEPRPAATVAILRDSPRGPEVLLTHRPTTMAFGPGLHVFPLDAERLLAAEVSVVDLDDLVAAGDVTLRVVAAPDGRADAVGYRIEGTGIVLGAERPDLRPA